jgi:hypothetical protein
MLDFHISMAEELVMNNGDLFADDFSGRHVLEAAKAYFKLTENPDGPTIPMNEFIERREDMGGGRLRLLREEDGDICVAVISENGEMAGIQFCTSVVGGGRSPKVLKALYQLAQAMIEENQEHPIAQ